MCLTKGREREVRGRPGDDDRANGVFEVLKIKARWRKMIFFFNRFNRYLWRINTPYIKTEFYLFISFLI